jgi:hypothetical protein
MSAKSFELLLESAYAPEQPDVFKEGAITVYNQFEQVYKTTVLKTGKSTDEVNFRFERLRIGVAIAFIKAFVRLADNEKSKEVLTLLQQALKANSTNEIDKIIQKNIASFDELYHEIFVNEQREYILELFERTLDADAKQELDELMLEGLEFLQGVDLDQSHDDDDDPIDEDLLKSIK